MFALLAGLGIVTMALFPIAVPGLLLLVVAPLLLIGLVGLLLAIPLVLPLWLLRALRRGRSHVAGPGAVPPREVLTGQDCRVAG